MDLESARKEQQLHYLHFYITVGHEAKSTGKLMQS